MAAWHQHYGSWWMVQWSLDGWVSLGVHVDFRTRRNSTCGEKYGPYVDLHLGCFIVSLGRNPVRSGEIDLKANCGRGGEA